MFSMQFAKAAVSRTILARSAIVLALYDAASNPPPITSTDRFTAVPLLSWQEFFLSIVVLLFGVFVVTLQYRLLLAAKSRADEALRSLTVTLIVVVSLALVSSGYGKDQITPVLGLFGTIVGYLLGSARSANIHNRSGKVSPRENDDDDQPS
jgi:hypothetical protein